MATTQNFSWPSSSEVVITGIGNPTGTPVPADAVYVAGEDPSGNLHGLQTDASGNLKVTLTTPSAIQDVNLSEVGGASVTLGQKAMAASLPVTIASDQSTLPISAASLPLPAGAATAANQSTEITALQTIEANQTNGTQVVSVSNFPATQPVSGTVAIDQTTPGTTNGVVINSSALPTGAATAANQATSNGYLSNIQTETTATANNTAGLQLNQGSTTSGQAGPLILGAVTASAPSYTTLQTQPISLTTAGAVRVDGSGGTFNSTGRSLANASVYLDYSSTNVTTSAYVEVLTATGAKVNMVEIFDSSGQALHFATGGIGVESNQFSITPGGNGQVPFAINSGVRISLKAITATANSGYIIINFYT